MKHFLFIRFPGCREIASFIASLDGDPALKARSAIAA